MTDPNKPAPPLSGAAIRHLRALGHDRAPVVMIGKEGLTPSLTKATNAALLTHELIKVKVQGEAPVDRKEAAEELARATEAVLAQILGRTFLLYKRHPKKPKIVLPGTAAARKIAAKDARKKPAATAKKRAAAPVERDDDGDEPEPDDSEREDDE
jgi:RNA-binding protein